MEDTQHEDGPEVGPGETADHPPCLAPILARLARSEAPADKPNHLWTTEESGWFTALPKDLLLVEDGDLNKVRTIRRSVEERAEVLGHLVEFLSQPENDILDLRFESYSISLSIAGGERAVPSYRRRRSWRPADDGGAR